MREESGVSARSLDGAFARGVAWTAGAKWTSQIFTWGSTIAVARMLSPEDYGLVGMAGAFLMLTQVMSEFGLGLTVLQMRELEGDVLRQLNSAAVIQGISIFLLAASAAPLLGWFYADATVPLVFTACALTFVISSFSSIPIALIRRKLDYRTLSVADVFYAIAQAVVTLGCALAGLGYWSLVVGYVAGALTHLVVILLRARIGFSWPRWKEIKPAIQFGSKVFTSSFATSLYSNSARLVVGKQMGADLLGAYQMAGILANAPVQKLGDMVMRVTSPVFAKSQNDLPLLRRYFLSFSEVLSIVILPLTIGGALLAEDLVFVAFGADWIAAAEPMRWLCCFVIFRLLSSLMGQALYSLRESQLLMHRSLAALAVFPVAFYLASFYGLGAVAAVWGLSIPLIFFPSLVRLRKRAGFRYREFLNALAPSACCTGLMIVAVLWAQSAIAHQLSEPFSRLLAFVSVGGLVYVGTMLIFFRSRIERYRRFWMNLRTKDAAPDEMPAA